MPAASASPLDVVRRLAGQEPDWVHECQLPLWLVKGYEEKIKRLETERSAAVVQQAIRGMQALQASSNRIMQQRPLKSSEFIARYSKQVNLDSRRLHVMKLQSFLMQS